MLRHAKSDWSDPALADRDRPLTSRGKRSRNAIAEHVAAWKVDLLISSPARRARATAKPIVKALGCRVRYDDALYAAAPARVLHVVRALSEPDDVVMMVGHNPWVEELTAMLCGATPRYPTAALGTLHLAVELWSAVSPRCGTLAAFVTAAELR